LLSFKRRVKLFFQKKKSYQGKRDNEFNWDLIRSSLIESKNALDVACNSGFYSFKLAETGCFVIGFDISEAALKNARDMAKSKNVDNVHFMDFALTPLNVVKLPKFDTVLCLSVYHHFFRLYGEDKAKEMLINLFKITNKKMYLQISSKIGKYGDNFSIDLKGDQNLTESYIRNIFFKEVDCNISYIGKKREKPPSEKYRYLFLISRIN
jgi:SAM-dependent methyltransferase